jgi:hypothetical protein
MSNTKKILGTFCATALLLAGNAKAVSVSFLPDISLLTTFTTFGNLFNDQNVTINGNVGISENGHLSLEAPSAITGDVYLGTGATASGGGWPGQVGGSVFINQNLAAAQAQVIAAANTLAGLTPDVTLASLNTGLAVTGNGGVKVVNITGNVSLGSGEHITFSGSADDYFVLNIFGDLDMSGDAAIKGIDGVSASHILINLYSPNSLGNAAHVDNVINGQIFIPYATYAEFHSINGAVFGGFGGDGTLGSGEIKLMSGATVTSVAFQSVPDAGSTLALMGLGLGLLVAGKRKFLS